MSKKILVFSLSFAAILLVWYFLFDKAPLQGDWQEQLAVISTAEFNGDLVMVKNVRNFRYYPTEADIHPAYYDKTYDLTQIKKVWYVTEPFNENTVAAHTFVSFEFNNGDFLSISIEARKTKGQKYSTWKGMLHSYPLVYIAADERDVVLMRANMRKDKVYVYPAKLEKPENARLLFVDMLQRMNELTTIDPTWYNTLFANCTSSIADHVNKLTPGRISIFSWQLWLTASADELALQRGLLDTNLPIEQARERFSINELSEKIGDTTNYSNEIRRKSK
ncbi:MAG: hypothetical protein COU40_02180 [Candidatus Moranbacteria bacterium CG10_big_fil_rev_8_21_14_0_10_35_21]|nr:MAG: hypothetical protein COU40_02180 [Candidatus Moranbacteria bacterium CG10_big_fil_rev_8_21_14_0_10_35_21]PJA88822.1 MAG: hypothetical protein CO139_01135 [Candidatus Moranbacteria bacterium CG_4_9_14_3_um_filter_36_9]